MAGQSLAELVANVACQIGAGQMWKQMMKLEEFRSRVEKWQILAKWSSARIEIGHCRKFGRFAYCLSLGLSCLSLGKRFAGRNRCALI